MLVPPPCLTIASTSLLTPSIPPQPCTSRLQACHLLLHRWMSLTSQKGRRQNRTEGSANLSKFAIKSCQKIQKNVSPRSNDLDHHTSTTMTTTMPIPPPYLDHRVHQLHATSLYQGPSQQPTPQPQTCHVKLVFTSMAGTHIIKDNSKLSPPYDSLLTPATPPHIN